MALLLATGQVNGPDPAMAVTVRADAQQLLGIGQQLETHGRLDQARQVYVALSHDTDGQVRSEARFRMAKLLAAEGRTQDAAVLLRRVVGENPHAAPARLELAALLAKLGQEELALRELRALRTIELPPTMARFVDRWSAALQARKPFGVQVELAIAPDSNINRATRSDKLGTVIGDFVFDDDSKERSGIGAALRGTANGRLELSRQVSLAARVVGDASLYRDRQFNDVAAELSAGPEVQLGRTRLSLDLAAGQQWHGMKPYQTSLRAAGSAIFSVDAVSQVRLEGGLRRTDNRVNDLQDGRGWSLRGRYERALSPQLSISASVSLDRFHARDDAYSTRSWLLGATAYREVGRMTFSAGAEIGRLKGDDRLALLPDSRDERFTRLSFGVVTRQFVVAGFAPIARLSFERNRSNVAFYDYRRTRTELGFSRAF